GTALNEGDELIVEGEPTRTGSVFSMQGDKTTKQNMAAPGDVIAIAKLDSARSGALIRSKGSRDGCTLAIAYPARNTVVAVAARDRRDDVKLSTALRRLCEEDPALEWVQDEKTHETLLRGINDDHLNVVLGRLERRYGVRVETRAPRIAYRESIRRP